jgi:hypothetical protein
MLGFFGNAQIVTIIDKMNRSGDNLDVVRVIDPFTGGITPANSNTESIWSG